jgi:hypothetical protein
VGSLLPFDEEAVVTTVYGMGDRGHRKTPRVIGGFLDNGELIAQSAKR